MVIRTDVLLLHASSATSHLVDMGDTREGGNEGADSTSFARKSLRRMTCPRSARDFTEWAPMLLYSIRGASRTLQASPRGRVCARMTERQRPDAPRKRYCHSLLAPRRPPTAEPALILHLMQTTAFATTRKKHALLPMHVR